MKPLAPKTLLQDRYQIIKIIGKGGMGEVYLATDTRLGNEVALKRTTVGDDSNLAAAFEREARTLAGLRHPVLPKVSDHFLENEEQFLVMDFIDGEDLSQRLKSSVKPFPLSWVLFWADELLEALVYLHTNDPPIIHRDIKPQNLKLTSDNHVVLLDFGLSKNALGNTRVTTSGSVVGYTPHYAPMEQIRGTGTNAKSDLYALSATLYQLLTNTVPPDALTRADSVLSNLPDPLRPLSEMNGEISESISNAIAKGMEISQDKRFSDAREMQKALRRAFGSMQESMAAKTVAFNIDEVESPAGLSESDAKTQIDIELPVQTNPGRSESVQNESPVVPGDAEQEEPSGTGPNVSHQAGSAVSGDAGQMAPGAETETPEVVPVAVVPEAAESDVSVPPDLGMEPVSEIDSASVETTTPDEFRDAVVESPSENVESKAAAAGAPISAKNPVTPPPAKSKGKSSAGKYVAILLGLGAVLLLILGSAAAGVWYYTQGGFSIGNENAAEPTPTVESTVEDTKVAEPANVDVNGNAENTESPDYNVNTEASPSPPATKSEPDKTVPQTRPTVRKTPVAVPPPARKTPVRPPPTAKPTPSKKKDPGVI